MAAEVEEAIKRYRCTASVMEVVNLLRRAYRKAVEAHTKMEVFEVKLAERDHDIAKTLLRDVKRALTDARSECSGLELCSMNPLGDCVCGFPSEALKMVEYEVDQALKTPHISEFEGYVERALKMATGMLASCSCKLEVEVE